MPLTPSNDEKHRDALYARIFQRYSIGLDRIESTLLCTCFQRDSVRRGCRRQAIGHVIHKILENIDVTALATTWEEVVRQRPALRMRNVSHSGEIFKIALLESLVYVNLTIVHQGRASDLTSGPRPDGLGGGDSCLLRSAYGFAYSIH